MQIVNKNLNLKEFESYVKTNSFSPNDPNKLVIHHTWKPTKESWAGERTLIGIKNHYEAKGWSAGPHLFIAEDGIWLFTPMYREGVHAGVLNANSIGIEVVGDYDDKVWSGETLNNAVGAIRILMGHLNLSLDDIYFHRDVSAKTCPGKMITKQWLFNQLKMNDKAPDWAKEALEWNEKHKIMKNENPNDPVTRAELAVVAKRLVDLLIDTLSKIK